MKTKNNLSLDGQSIQINNRKYVLMEFGSDSTSFLNMKPILKINVDITKEKFGEEVKI